MRENMRQASRVSSSAWTWEPEGRWADCGLMSGTGATLLSGRVSVLARRMVVEAGLRTRGVGMGTSESLYRTRLDIGKESEGAPQASMRKSVNIRKNGEKGG